MRDHDVVGNYRAPQLSAAASAPAPAPEEPNAGDFTFGDFLDIINPLQHIPIVSTIYRAITGDEIKAPARIFGDTLFGGPAGFLSAVANVLFEQTSGKDFGETMVAFLQGGEADADPQVASAGSPETLPAPIETAAAPAQPPAPAPTPADAVAERDAVEAAMPKAGPGMLTGEDALHALFMDLRGRGSGDTGIPLAKKQAEALPLPGHGKDAGGAKFYRLPTHRTAVPATPPQAPVEQKPATEAAAQPAPGDPQAGSTGESAVHPLIFAQQVPKGAIADRMMEALDKYRAMSRQSEAGNKRDDEKDKDRVRWETDPGAAGGDS